MTLATITSFVDSTPVFRPPEAELSLAELMERLDWDAYIRRWLAFSRSRLMRYGAAASLLGLQPNDCVQEAIGLALEGRRRFERGTEDEFFVFICGVIRSVISHTAEKTFRDGIVELAIAAGTDAPAGDAIDEGRISSREDIERDFLFRDDLEKFLAWVDEDLASYARLRAEGACSSAEECAEALGISVPDVRNMDRRLRRRREQWTSQTTASTSVM
jgi:DNA-directed RNA polymerase specialized sigma24 family protein